MVAPGAEATKGPSAVVDAARDVRASVPASAARLGPSEGPRVAPTMAVTAEGRPGVGEVDARAVKATAAPASVVVATAIAQTPRPISASLLDGASIGPPYVGHRAPAIVEAILRDLGSGSVHPKFAKSARALCHKCKNTTRSLGMAKKILRFPLLTYEASSAKQRRKRWRERHPPRR